MILYCKNNYTLFTLLLVVPPPRVEVSINSAQFHSDNRVMLLCTVTLSATAISQVSVETLWSGPNGQLGNSSSSVIISNTYRISNGVFQSTVTISNYVTSVYNGDYLCNATVVPTSPYIVGISAVARKSVAVSGWYFAQFRYLQ